MSKKVSTKNTPSIEEKYQKIEHREHVLLRPGMYIGSIQRETGDMDIFDDTTNKIIRTSVTYTPGFYKTFDEELVNAFDHSTRETTCTDIKVNVNKEQGLIKVWNNGPGIPVTIHKEHNIYVPEMIFGNLLSSSNYYNDDDEDRVTSGLNGLGIKLCNIYSTRFIIETLDTEHGKKKYIQEFKNNMTEKCEPTITKPKSKSEPYTCVSYYPDFEKFKMECMSDEDVMWMKKRAYDIAACTGDNVKVYFNDEEIKVNTFEDYIKMCYDEDPNLTYSHVSDRWKIGCVFVPDNGGKQVSFVNGTSTYEGGSHVDYILNQIITSISMHIKTKYKLQVKAPLIKEHIDIFVNATIVNPEFPSQTKSKLTSKPAKFGSTCEIPKAFIDSLIKSGLIDLVVKNAQFKEQSQLNKTDGKKTSMLNVPKLEDALWAGTKRSSECRLFLTEGDSAFSYFKNGLSIVGREKYGGFPLRGKLLNIRNATYDQIKNNEEFISLKKIMGLKQGTKYTDTKDLRYGGIVILTDADADGSHIMGLIINMLQCCWPELLKLNDFIQMFPTILVRAWKKTDKKKANPIEFYSEVKFDDWIKTVNPSKYDVKYYKGLGTSDDKTARKSFIDFDNKVISLNWEEQSEEVKERYLEREKEEREKEEKKKGKKQATKKNKLDTTTSDPDIVYSPSYEKLVLAFDEKYADDRKVWLSNYDKNNILEYDKTNITYTEFIDGGLKHFSNYDNVRNLPNIMDGLKPSQRKIMYICFEDNIKKGIKVADLASEVSKRTAYKHGNKSLEDAIISMASDFTGSNNINLLVPDGNFGHRWCNGNDAASSRYIYTCLENIATKIFVKEDELILTKLFEDGKLVEPNTFYPIIPMILVNGCNGIGTGFATTIPQYNPLDICDNLLCIMEGKNMKNMTPWYSGFKGSVEREIDDKDGQVYYRITGVYETQSSKNLTITEIPLGTKQSLCPQEYENELLKPMAGITYISQKDLEKQKEKKKKGEEEPKKKKQIEELLDRYYNKCGNNDINFELEFKGNEMQYLFKKNTIIETLKLSTTISITNMYLYNSKGFLQKYSSPEEIIADFYKIRLEKYVERRAKYLKYLHNELEILKNKVRYINDILTDQIIVNKRKKDNIFEQLEKKNYPKLSKNPESTEEEKSYEYLSQMLLFSLTEEKIEELELEYKNKEKEYNDYNSLTPIELWKRELIEFKKSYIAWLDEKAERNEDDIDGNSKSKKSSKKKKN